MQNKYRIELGQEEGHGHKKSSWISTYFNSIVLPIQSYKAEGKI